MRINIGDNNKINKSIIGSNNQRKKEENKLFKIFIEVLIGLLVGLIVAFFVYRFGWNK
ncbi:MAG: hypothetical protein ACTTGJ_03750 [Clostridium sp.]